MPRCVVAITGQLRPRAAEITGSNPDLVVGVIRLRSVPDDQQRITGLLLVVGWNPVWRVSVVEPVSGEHWTVIQSMTNVSLIQKRCINRDTQCPEAQVH